MMMHTLNNWHGYTKKKKTIFYVVVILDGYSPEQNRGKTLIYPSIG